MFTLKRYSNPQLIYVENQDRTYIEWGKKDDSFKLFSRGKLTWKIHINKKCIQDYTEMRTILSLSKLQINRPLTLTTYSCPFLITSLFYNNSKNSNPTQGLLRLSLKVPWFIKNKQINDMGYFFYKTRLKPNQKISIEIEISLL